MRALALVVAAAALVVPGPAAAKGCKEKRPHHPHACPSSSTPPTAPPQAPEPAPAVPVQPAVITPKPQPESHPSALPAPVDPAALMPAFPAQRPSVSRSGKVALRLRCPRQSRGGCSGTVTLSIARARAGHAKVAGVSGARVGRRRFQLAPGTSRRVSVRLSRRALRRLRRRHKLAVTVAVTVKAGGRSATSTRRVTILDRRTAAHRPSRKKHKPKRRRR